MNNVAVQQINELFPVFYLFVDKKTNGIIHK